MADILQVNLSGIFVSNKVFLKCIPNGSIDTDLILPESMLDVFPDAIECHLASMR